MCSEIQTNKGSKDSRWEVDILYQKEEDKTMLKEGGTVIMDLPSYVMGGTPVIHRFPPTKSSSFNPLNRTP